MNSFYQKYLFQFFIKIILLFIFSIFTQTHAENNSIMSYTNRQYLDGIAAIINDNIITVSEIQDSIVDTEKKLCNLNIDISNKSEIQNQVLRNLITETLLQQEAQKIGIDISDYELEQIIKSIAKNKKISINQLCDEIERNCITWNSYKKNIKKILVMKYLRQHLIEPKIKISEGEIDFFLETQNKSQKTTQPISYTLSQILIRIPELATPDEIDFLKIKAESLLEKINNGADFSEIANTSSDDQESSDGGFIGTRLQTNWPDLFVNAVCKLQPGQVSEIIQSKNGFHILKLIDQNERITFEKKIQTEDQLYEFDKNQFEKIIQTRVSHILIRLSEVTNTDQTKNFLESIRNYILSGKSSFEDMAIQYSQDITALQGGDLDWVSPGQMIPEFEIIMNSLKFGDISKIITSQFGYHLIQVKERRLQNIPKETQRMQAHQILKERHIQLLFDNWLKNLYNGSFIDIRI